MRIFYNFGKLLILLLIVWLAILVFLLGGPLSRSSEEEELLAKKLSEMQSENRKLMRERDKLVRQLREVSRSNGGGAASALEAGDSLVGGGQASQVKVTFLYTDSYIFQRARSRYLFFFLKLSAIFQSILELKASNFFL